MTVVAAVEAASIRIHRIIATSEQAFIDGRGVSLTDAHGPAVFGYFRPRILVPRSLLERPPALQKIVKSPPSP